MSGMSNSLLFSLSSLSSLVSPALTHTHTHTRNLAEFVLERENKKHHFAQIETDIFKRRYQLEDWSGSILSSLRPVSTHTDTRHPATVGDGWESRHSLIKVSRKWLIRRTSSPTHFYFVCMCGRVYSGTPL